MRRISLQYLGFALGICAAACSDGSSDATEMDAGNDSATILADSMINLGDSSPDAEQFEPCESFDGDQTGCEAESERCVWCAGSQLCSESRSDSSQQLVFATSKQTTGNIGGLDGGDVFCMQRSREAELTGCFKAWLSTSVENASARLTHHSTPYRLVDGTTIANDWTDLTDDSLQAPINLDEFGNTPPVWEQSGNSYKIVLTATKADGTFRAGKACGSWTNETGSTEFGRWNQSSHYWTYAYTINLGAPSCGYSAVLYCFQQ